VGGSAPALSDLGSLAALIVLARHGRIVRLPHARGQDRLKPLLISLACLGVAVVLCQYVKVHLLLRRLALTQFSEMALMLVLTRAWQISFHGAATGALLTAALLFFGARVWPKLGLLRLVSWSQAERRHHTTARVATGMVLSIVFYALGPGEA
jgi:hypothetical protein